MEKITQEILKLAFKLSIENCEGCVKNYGSQKDHSCLKPYYYNLVLEEAIEKIKNIHKIFDSLEFVYEKYHMKDY